MSRGMAIAAVLGVTLALGNVGASGTTVKVGELAITASASFSPKRLTGRGPTAVALELAGRARTVDGAPPALRKIDVEADKDIVFATKGLPRLQRQRAPCEA